MRLLCEQLRCIEKAMKNRTNAHELPRGRRINCTFFSLECGVYALKMHEKLKI
jgi:hypothetical protein